MRSRGGRSHDDILLGMCVVAVGGVWDWSFGDKFG